MKISAAALLLFILAAALGLTAQAFLQPQPSAPPAPEILREVPDTHRYYLRQPGLHRFTDCCHYYTRRNIRCALMESYYITSSHCSLAAVLFKTKKGQEVCANPRSVRVQRCMKKLHSAIPGKRLLKEKLH